MESSGAKKSDDKVAIVRGCFEAYVRKDRAAIEKLIAEDFHFTSPLDNRLDRESYFKICWPNSNEIQNFDLINLVPSGDKVFVTYEGKSVNGNFRNTEIHTLHNNQIIEVEVYFGWSLPHKAKAGTHIPPDEETDSDPGK